MRDLSNRTPGRDNAADCSAIGAPLPISHLSVQPPNSPHVGPALALDPRHRQIAIEAARTALQVLPIDVPMRATLRQTAAGSPRICPPGSKATA